MMSELDNRNDDYYCLLRILAGTVAEKAPEAI